MGVTITRKIWRHFVPFFNELARGLKYINYVVFVRFFWKIMKITSHILKCLNQQIYPIQHPDLFSKWLMVVIIRLSIYFSPAFKFNLMFWFVYVVFRGFSIETLSCRVIWGISLKNQGMKHHFIEFFLYIGKGRRSLTAHLRKN